MPINNSQAQTDEAPISRKTDRPDTSFWRDLWLTKDQQAQQLQRREQYDQAAATFDNPQWRGVAEFKAGDFSQAADTFAELDMETADNKNINDQHLAENHYNRGHALAHNGKLDDSIAAYEQALAIAPSFEQAKQAKAIVEAMKKQQDANKEQQANQQNNDSGDDSGDKESDNQTGDGGKSPNEERSDNQQSSQGDDDQSNGSDDKADNNSGPDTSAGDQAPPQNSDPASSANQQQDEQSKNQHADEENTALKEYSDKELDQASKKEQQSVQTSDTENQAQKPDAAQSEQQTRSASAEATELSELSDAEQQKIQQWFNKIADDPGGLLRRKFDYERQLRERQGDVIEESESGQVW